MYFLKSGGNYIGVGANNRPTTVLNRKNALEFENKDKAENYKNNLKKTLKKFNWEVVEIIEKAKESQQTSTCIEEVESFKTTLESKNFDIVDFFQQTILTLSQLKQFAFNMQEAEKEYNKKIKDVRHYKRDKRVKLNAIQLQRLEKFEIQLERERYEHKSNRIIAEIFLNDISRLESPDYIKIIKNVKDSEYNPEILTYEELDRIVGKER